MKSIQRRFESIRAKNPNYTAYLCLANAVIGHNFSRDRIRRAFNRLVPESDYGDGERLDTFRFLAEITKQKIT
jgi:hypothetical protein